MFRFGVLLGLIVLCSLGLGFSVDTSWHQHTGTRILGYPVVSRGGAEPAWLQIGEGEGALFVGGAGGGIVAFGFAVVGILFGIGQASTGLIAIGQGALGLIAVVGQVGTGLLALGQLIFGGYGIGQLRIAGDGSEILTEINEDLGDLFKFG